MSRSQPRFYRRVRRFCELPVHIVSSATGISISRIQAIETGAREANPTERRLLERFLQNKLRAVFQMEGGAPKWIRVSSAELGEVSGHG
jgi:hypothetical protein